MTLVSEVFYRHQHVRFRKIGRGAATRNVVSDDPELAGDACLTFVVADQIDNLSGRKTTQVNVFRIQKYDAPAVVNAPITIVEPVNRRIELIVTAHGHHQELTGLKIDPRQRMNGEVGAPIPG